MKGLIASVLGGVSRGVGEVAAGQIELNSRKALMEAEEEMRARLAEAAEGRAETRQIAAEGRAETRQIAAEDRAIQNIGREAQAEEDILARRYGEGSKYPGLISQQISAQETPSQRATREREELLADDDQRVRDVRQTLAAMDPNDPLYRSVKRQLDVLTGGTARLDPLVAAEIEDLQYQIRRATAEYESALDSFDDTEITVAKERLNRLQRQADRLFGRSSSDDDPLGLL
jgi:hypothetical protein